VSNQRLSQNETACKGKPMLLNFDHSLVVYLSKPIKILLSLTFWNLLTILIYDHTTATLFLLLVHWGGGGGSGISGLAIDTPAVRYCLIALGKQIAILPARWCPCVYDPVRDSMNHLSCLFTQLYSPGTWAVLYIQQMIKTIGRFVTAWTCSLARKR